MSVGIAWISVNYYREYPTSLPDCFPASLALYSIAFLVGTFVDVIDTARRVEKFFQRQRTE